MPTRRVVKSVLHNFLGTYTSRNSDYRGYWLFGQLPPDRPEWTVDLLGSAPEGDAPMDVARRLAIRRFAEQLSKSGRTLNSVREATLQVASGPKVVEGQQGDSIAEGHVVRYNARVVMGNRRVYEDERKVFVARHDPGKEMRRNEDDWGT